MQQITAERATHEPALSHMAPGHIRTLAVLVLLGAGLVAGSWQLAQWSFVPGHPVGFGVLLAAELILYALASVWVIRRQPPSRSTFILVFIVAAVARLLLVPLTPTFSDDVYRYVWDGRIQAAGINPYEYPPNAPELARFRDVPIYPGINRKPVRTIYPPVAQAFFRLVYALHPDSLPWTKLALVVCDLAVCAVLAWLLRAFGMRPERVILYAWHPLPVIEVAHSGHLDVVAVLFVVLAVGARVSRRFGWAGALLAGAVLVKYYALIALPALLARSRRAWGAVFGTLGVVIVLAYLPFLSVGTHVFGYLGGYVEEEGIATGNRYFLLQQMSWVVRHVVGSPTAPAPSAAAIAYQIGIIAAMAAAGIWCVLRPATSVRGIANRVAVLFIVLFALASPVQPWYLLLLLAMLPIVDAWLIVPISLIAGGAELPYLTWWLPGKPIWPAGMMYDARALALIFVLLYAANAWRTHRGLAVSQVRYTR